MTKTTSDGSNTYKFNFLVISSTPPVSSKVLLFFLVINVLSWGFRGISIQYTSRVFQTAGNTYSTTKTLVFDSLHVFALHLILQHSRHLALAHSFAIGWLLHQLHFKCTNIYPKYNFDQICAKYTWSRGSVTQTRAQTRPPIFYASQPPSSCTHVE